MDASVFTLCVGNSCVEYEARLETCKRYLANTTLDDLYSNEGIVGYVLDDDWTLSTNMKTKQQASSTLGSQRVMKQVASV
jgi:hypothetical protein